MNSVYQRGDAISDILSESLVRLDKNFEVHPGAATEWSVGRQRAGVDLQARPQPDVE